MAAPAAHVDEWSYGFGADFIPGGQGERILLQAAEKLGHILVRRDAGIVATGVHFILQGQSVEGSVAFLAYATQLVIRVALLHVPRPVPRIIEIRLSASVIGAQAKYAADAAWAVTGISINWREGLDTSLGFEIGSSLVNDNRFSAESYEFTWTGQGPDDAIRVAALNTLDDMIGRVEGIARAPCLCDIHARGGDGPHAVTCVRRPRRPSMGSIDINFRADSDWRSAIHAFYVLLYELDGQADFAGVWKNIFRITDEPSASDPARRERVLRILESPIASIFLTWNDRATVPYTAIVRRVGWGWAGHVRVPYEPQSFRHSGWLRRLLDGKLEKTSEQMAREAAEREAAVAAGRPPPLQMSYLLPVGVRDIVARLAGACIDTPVARGADGRLVLSETAREHEARAAAALRRRELEAARARRDEVTRAARAAHAAEGRPSDDDDDNEGLDQ